MVLQRENRNAYKKGALKKINNNSMKNSFLYFYGLQFKKLKDKVFNNSYLYDLLELIF
ncbi:MAG: hypothetical protein PWR20_1955 [Bacteroidales bacterium]|jgi:hypothetical protein|nr:hypothetical protein [Bacteroidales bacterium]MDN5330474.1 hypothetical protein [Bacteroidales bacterium]